MRVRADIADDIRYFVDKWASMFEAMLDEQYQRIDQKNHEIRETRHMLLTICTEEECDELLEERVRDKEALRELEGHDRR